MTDGCVGRASLRVAGSRDPPVVCGVVYDVRGRDHP